MKALTSTQKLAIWWPNTAVTSAEHDVLEMGSSVWRYKYGSVTFADPSADQLAVVSAAADPTDVYNFIWDTQDPQKIISQSSAPPITSSRWNPDVGHSTNTADVLNMTFYKSLNVADSSTLKTNGSSVPVGFIYWPDSSNAADKWSNTGDNIEWVADTSTPAGGNNN